MTRIKVKMLLDTKGQRGGFLLSPNVYLVNYKFAKGLIKKGRAREYDEIEDSKRIVNLDGKVMTWSEYLKYKRKKK